MMRQCPLCGSWQTTRHVAGFSVWFTCDRCGHRFS
jgi:ribosomal protein L37AE/L43A